MSIYQDLAAIERIQQKSLKRVNKFTRRLKKRGHVRMSIFGMAALTGDLQILRLTDAVLSRVAVTVVA